MLTFKILQRPFLRQGGKAFTAEIAGISDQDFVCLLEDGQKIGAPHTGHDHIRTYGNGRFSVWGKHLYFSSSDGSDCETNGREYRVLVIDRADFREDVIKHLATDGETVLRALADTKNQNGNVAHNFFWNFNFVRQALERSGSAWPKSVIELGCSEWTYMGLRFLTEGTEFYIANDLGEVGASYPASLIDALLEACELIDSRLALRAKGILQRHGETYEARGLVAKGRTSFDQLKPDRPIEFIHSTSTLEHLMNPAEAVAQMARLLAPGALMFHRIDLQDHRYFKGDPFAFYRLTESEYAALNTENRLRASDWMKLFEAAGFQIIDRLDRTAYVNEADIETFAEPFKHMDISDLSVAATNILCRKK